MHAVYQNNPSQRCILPNALPHGDLILQNDIQQDYQPMIKVGNTLLIGEWRASCPDSYSTNRSKRSMKPNENTGVLRAATTNCINKHSVSRGNCLQRG